MKAITVSTDVFAAIWASREDGEDDEDAVLRRLLECPRADGEKAGNASDRPVGGGSGGVDDVRNGVYFPQGFEAFRTYKGQHYHAVAENGMWRRVDTGERFPTLNQVNGSIVEGVENVWNGNWRYHDSDGLNRSIDDLRSKG